MAVNVENVALIFEGGGLRNAYTSAIVTTLLENEIYFPKAYGISAGAILAAGYTAQDAAWTHAMFTDSVKIPHAGGAKSFFHGHGFFDLQFMLEGLAEENASNKSVWNFDFDTFRKNGCDMHIEAFACKTGLTAQWTKKDIHTLTDLMYRVAASCSYPLFTPAITIDGVRYVDGGIGESHGICLDAARRDGFERFFICRTQPRSYRMPNMKAQKRLAYKIAYSKYPKVYSAMVGRAAQYNALLDEVERLRECGSAYVFCPDVMPITYMTTDFGKLCETYRLGMEQCRREFHQWLHFIDEAGQQS